MFRKFVLFSVLFWSTEVYAESISQKMDVEIGVFDAAEITLDYEERDGRYDIRAMVKTANLFDTLYPFSGQYQSIGKVLKQCGILPQQYITSNKTRSHKRRKRLFYDDEGKAYKSVSAKDEKEKVRQITNVPQNADAADLQAVFAELIHNFRQKKSCALSREVYDGKKHYKVIVRDVQRANRLFEGLNRTENAYQCSIYIENLKNNNDNILWDVSADKPINVWIGYDEKAKMPYLLEIKIDSTPLGELKVSPKTLELK
ncbi:MAG: DUF3108 domain-containing protein [Acetobacter sp.]|nr:DUF3108 domain-containing protein [Acetobacter sp.]